MRAKAIIIVAVLALSFGLLAGCYESPDVTLRKPGVYKGPKDPLVEKQRAPEQQQALVVQFNSIQTDR